MILLHCTLSFADGSCIHIHASSEPLSFVEIADAHTLDALELASCGATAYVNQLGHAHLPLQLHRPSDRCNGLRIREKGSPCLAMLQTSILDSSNSTPVLPPPELLGTHSEEMVGGTSRASGAGGDGVPFGRSRHERELRHLLHDGVSSSAAGCLFSGGALLQHMGVRSSSHSLCKVCPENKQDAY